MTSPIYLSFLLATTLTFLIAKPSTAARPTTLNHLARQALSENEAEAGAAVAALRREGEAGLEALFLAYADELKEFRPHDARGRRIGAAIDAVARQRYATTSRLYWYTDLDEAKRAARAGGKPILSLRLLGNLDEEYSCANSRFFRVALYPNAEVSRFLRERFVLHWQSERPAPRVTVDFGDGRKLFRTVTGNSIHYILNSEGQLIDALPGLSGPQAFLRELRTGEMAARRVAALADARTRAEFLRRFHTAQITDIAAAWRDDLQKAGIVVPPERASMTGKRPAATATQAAPRAVSKMVVERPLLGALTTDHQTLARISDEAGWNEIARLHAGEARLDAPSVALLRSLRRAPDGNEANQEASLTHVIRKFETLLALDTVRNRYAMHLTLHEWLAGGTHELEIFNERVYTELFLTPRTDPWLGLMTGDDFSALENDGLVF